MQLVWTTTLPAPKKLVLLALADNANDEGDCYPSVATLSSKCSLSERAVQYAITDLVGQGHVSREVRSGRSTVYKVHPRTSCTPALDAPVQDMHPTPASGAPHPRTSCTHNHQITVNEPSRRAASGGPKNSSARDPAGEKAPEETTLDKALFAEARKVFGQSIGGQINTAIRLKGKAWIVDVIEACRAKDQEAARAYLAAAMRGVSKPNEAQQRKAIP